MRNYLLILIISFSIFVLFCSCGNNKTSQKKEYKDTLVAIKEITKVYSNGYIEINCGERFFVKISSEKLSNLQNNMNNYFIKHKIIPENEIADIEVYKVTLLNTSTNEEYPIKNKYCISDNEFNSIIDLVIKDESRKSECFAKVKNKRNILDIEFFDLNSDGQDEYIVWCSNSCFVYNHCMDVYVLEKVGNNLITLSNVYTEGFEISNKISKGYFIFEDYGTAGPEAIIKSYKYNGTKYVESGTIYEKIDIE